MFKALKWKYVFFLMEGGGGGGAGTGASSLHVCTGKKKLRRRTSVLNNHILIYCTIENIAFIYESSST